MIINKSTVTIMNNRNIPNPPYYALYKRSLAGYYYLYMRRNLTLEEIADIVKDIPSKWRAYPRRTPDPMPMPEYRLHAQYVDNDGKVTHSADSHSKNWYYICHMFDMYINWDFNNIVVRDINDKVILTRTPDGTITVAKGYELPKRQPRSAYIVTVYTNVLDKQVYRTSKLSYAISKFKELSKICGKVDLMSLTTGEILAYRDGDKWYYAKNDPTLQQCATDAEPTQEPTK